MTRVVEGACNYNFNNANQKKLFCNNSQIGSTNLRQKEFDGKLSKLFSLADKTKNLVFENEKNIKQNAKNNKALSVVTDPNGEEDTSEACKKYPEAC